MTDHMILMGIVCFLAVYVVIDFGWKVHKDAVVDEIKRKLNF